MAHERDSVLGHFVLIWRKRNPNSFILPQENWKSFAFFVLFEDDDIDVIMESLVIDMGLAHGKYYQPPWILDPNNSFPIEEKKKINKENLIE